VLLFLNEGEIVAKFHRLIATFFFGLSVVIKAFDEELWIDAVSDLTGLGRIYLISEACADLVDLCL
jgi:hypothetical protein